MDSLSKMISLGLGGMVRDNSCSLSDSFCKSIAIKFICPAPCQLYFFLLLRYFFYSLSQLSALLSHEWHRTFVANSDISSNNYCVSIMVDSSYPHPPFFNTQRGRKSKTKQLRNHLHSRPARKLLLIQMSHSTIDVSLS